MNKRTLLLSPEAIAELIKQRRQEEIYLSFTELVEIMKTLLYYSNSKVTNEDFAMAATNAVNYFIAVEKLPR